MKKCLQLVCMLFLLSGIVGYSFGQTESKEEAREKIWSKVRIDKSTIVPINPGYKYIPPPQIKRNVKVKDGFLVVGPNYRPWPTINSTQSEMSIDIHPTNNDILFGSANATNWPVTQLFGTGIYYTSNGGTNWTGFDNPPFGTNSGDPASVIGTNGYFYEGFIDGGANDGGQGIARSTNNGTNWTRYIVAAAPPGPDDLLDKNHLMVDKKSGSPFENRLYVAYTVFIIGDPNDAHVVLKYSTDFGQTWSTQKNISGALSTYLDQGVNIQTGPNGEVYAVWAIYDGSPVTNGEDGIGFNMSTDGGQTWGTPKKIYNAANFGIRGTFTNKADIRISSFPSMSVDISGGANNGNIYVTWPQKNVAPAGTSPDIVMIKSTDGGVTWTSPVRVNDDPISNGKDQYYPWMTVDQSTGHLYFLFYDSRNVNNDSAEVFLARSIDAGNSFENIKVSDAKFKPKPITGLAGGYQGDYIGIAALNNIVYPYWCDDRTGIYQGWTAKITFGPSIIHQPLANTEDLSGPFTVSARIESVLPLNPSRLYVYWGRGTPGTITDSILLVQVAPDSFEANIPGDGNPSTYTYYIYAEDSTGSFSTYPSGAPGNYLTFEVNTDTIPPVITHTNLSNQLREQWPAVVTAEVSDNIGVDSVWIIYKLNSNGALNSFPLTFIADSGTYSGLFNIDTSQIALGDTMFYRIIAKDSSAAGNLGYYPSSSGYSSFVFIPDNEFPVLTHIPLHDQAIIRWPATVRAVATDNLGVRSVTCEYSINDSSITGSFQLVPQGNNLWTGGFDIDTSQVNAGDSIAYRLKAIDNSTSQNTTYNPSLGYYGFTIINAKGLVLVVNDDITLAERYSNERASQPDLLTPLGASSTLFTTTLNNAGYLVDSTSFSSLDSTILNDYDMVVLSGGTKETAMFNITGIRTAIVNYTLAGGKTIVEGGEVGYQYRYASATSDKDPYFRRNILHDSLWISDYSDGDLNIRIPTHPIFNFPNTISGPINVSNSPGTGFGARDVVRIIPNKPGVIKAAGWIGGTANYPDTAGIIIYYQDGDTSLARNIFFTFAVSQIVDQQVAEQLIENAAEVLINSDLYIPVELISFSAELLNKSVILNWTTATEVNNRGFEIERTPLSPPFDKGGKQGGWVKIGFVNGNGTTTEPASYSFYDSDISEGTYSYRLKQIDFDGSIIYSNEVNVVINIPKIFSLEQNYPNPFNPSTLIKYSIPQDGFVNLAVYNLLGEKVVTLINENLKAGKYEVSFSASSLPDGKTGLASGVYFYRLESGNFVSIKKMMLLK